ncbi:hypothetical protein BU24DRAFT_275311 [Aaosphaeria arxii CBS 175.79]|uniref:M protein, serotype 2.1 n=1 Tax=Aaosphaeria arxii CBS 175.79 TaxID=1450172 RepID=A0A6A5XJ63_9PLEO|nr:uncharacterized protein BU24DRAFT_275311 [Aaosphaeria arxii CBS 175.79]KAF2012354.1 hypothetical protein BU24DRAFT_275311 [Aaosphaeria arxii CBS 175.79]
MSSTPARKPPAGSTGRDSSTKSSASPGAANRTPSRASTPTSNGTNGVQRTRSVRSGVTGTPVSARASVRKPGASSNLSTKASQDDANDEEAKEEAAAYLQDLKERLQKAESEADERQKQVEVLNARLDDAIKEQAKLEERAHEEEEKVEGLENEKRELTRQHRELEGIYEAERAQTMKEKESTQTKEDELHETIQRLKEAMAMKNTSNSDSEEGLSRTSSFRNRPSRNNSSQNLETSGSFAPPSSVQRSNSRNNSKLIHQKDKIIEGLRLELAENQIKLVELENAGGGRLRELEKQLLETRMTNARLMEDNESFQLLLSEKTLNGDLSRGDFLRSAATEERAPLSPGGPSTSLADELESAEGAEGELVRRLEGEVNSLKDQNKALTLYINKIIGRLLTHQGFESVLGNDDDGTGGAPALNTDKELPPPPRENDQPQSGFLQRAKSVAMGGGRPKPRPISYAPSSNVTEDPNTAPSIPLGRSNSSRAPSGSYTHRRSASELGSQQGAASFVNNMVRNPSPGVLPSPTSPGLVSPRNSFFGLPINSGSNPASRVPSSGAPIHEEREDAASTTTTGTSNTESGSGHVDTPSPPRRVDTAPSGGVMTGKQMRPLRLVQNEKEASQQRKAANRASWISGWFGGGEQQRNDGAPPQ